MKVTFDYNKEKDIWCLLKFGKSSTNSTSQTKAYKMLVDKKEENPTENETSIFVDKYIADKKINIQEYITNYQKDWDTISNQYKKVAERVFNVSLPEDIIAYLTVNDRCPYNIKDNFFLVSVPCSSMRNIAMHELWHFYTWYKFGVVWEEKLGKQKYNDLKEALTVLLNVECGELLSVGKQDNGYPQHKELREKIVQLWNKTKDIDKLWLVLVS